MTAGEVLGCERAEDGSYAGKVFCISLDRRC